MMIHFIKNLKSLSIDYSHEIKSVISLFCCDHCLNNEDSSISTMFLKKLINFYTRFKSHIGEEYVVQLSEILIGRNINQAMQLSSKSAIKDSCSEIFRLLFEMSFVVEVSSEI